MTEDVGRISKMGRKILINNVRRIMTEHRKSIHENADVKSVELQPIKLDYIENECRKAVEES